MRGMIMTAEGKSTSPGIGRGTEVIGTIAGRDREALPIVTGTLDGIPGDKMNFTLSM